MESQQEAELCFPQLLNTSCRRPTSRSNAVLLSVVLSLISALTLVLNLLVIISVTHFRQLHRPTNLLLLSLAVSDFLVGIVVMPGEIIRQTGCWSLGDLMCSLYKFLMFVATSASVGDMLLISVDRYVAICDPLHYTTRVTVTRVKVCICLCWFCSVLYSGLFVKDDLTHPGRHSSCYEKCSFVFSSTQGAVDLVLNFILPVTIIVVLYMRVFLVAVSQARYARSHVRAVTLQRPRPGLVKKSELKAARTLGLVLLVYLMCFCPFYGVSLTGENLFNTSTEDFVLCLFCFNPCLNPVIYALFYPWFRKGIKLIVTLQILQPGSSEASVL